MPDPADYRVILNTDDIIFEGHGIAGDKLIYPRQDIPMYGRDQSIQVYLPARSAQVLAPSAS
jgi:1,4-alpha-glucan branching enzyme